MCDIINISTIFAKYFTKLWMRRGKERMMLDSSILTIREATEQDAGTIAALAEDAGMGTLSPRGTAYVALAEARIVGFIRIVEADGSPYVSPIVVDPQARRLGVGRALMEFARERYGALMFVARGPAVPFYTALGCEQVARACISPALDEDCDTCPDFATCSPVPMIYR